MSEHLVFFLGRERYAFQAGKVQELMAPPPVTRVPQTPPYLLGVINLHGHALPLLDLRLKFGLPADYAKHQTTVLVVEMTVVGETVKFGLLVDAIAGVAEFDETRPPSDLPDETKTSREYILGLWLNPEGEFVVVLDPDKLFVEEGAGEQG